MSKIFTTTHSTFNDIKDYSKDNSEEYVIFDAKDPKTRIGFNDIDLMDFPLSGDLIALAGSLCEISNTFKKINIKTFKIDKLTCNCCAFCK